MDELDELPTKRKLVEPNERVRCYDCWNETLDFLMEEFTEQMLCANCKSNNVKIVQGEVITE